MLVFDLIIMHVFSERYLSLEKMSYIEVSHLILNVGWRGCYVVSMESSFHLRA